MSPDIVNTGQRQYNSPRQSFLFHKAGNSLAIRIKYCACYKLGKEIKQHLLTNKSKMNNFGILIVFVHVQGTNIYEEKGATVSLLPEETQESSSISSDIGKFLSQYHQRHTDGLHLSVVRHLLSLRPKDPLASAENYPTHHCCPATFHQKHSIVIINDCSLLFHNVVVKTT